MILRIATLVYVACDLLACGTGTAVLFGLLTGALFEKCAADFLRFALVASVIGLLFPYPHMLLTQRQELSMLTVYLSGVVIVAWRKFHLAGAWRSAFVLSATLVLYLSVLAAIAQVFRHTPLPNVMALAQLKSPTLIAHTVFLLLFLVLGVVAAREFRRSTQGIGHDRPAGIRNA